MTTKPDQPKIEQSQIDYFSHYHELHGVSAEGLNYGSEARQKLCFAQAAKVITHAPGDAFSLNDYGCGFADFLPFMNDRGYTRMRYHGYDVTPSVLNAARQRFSEWGHASFVNNEEGLPVADYTVAVGVFNIKQDTPLDAWREYVMTKLDMLWDKSRYGMSFNILTKYSDASKMRDYLYYADPTFYFDHCKRRYSHNVALLHDYGVYEFTILIRPS